MDHLILYGHDARKGICFGLFGFNAFFVNLVNLVVQ